MANTKKLTDIETQAWQGFLHAHATLTRDFSRSLEEHEGLTLTEYEVLLHLSDQPRGRSPMGELAAMVVLTPSGLTRLVDRLVERGFVAREAFAADARKSIAVITTAGKQKLRDATKRHLGDIHARFVDVLDTKTLTTLANTWEKVAPEDGAE